MLLTVYKGGCSLIDNILGISISSNFLHIHNMYIKQNNTDAQPRGKAMLGPITKENNHTYQDTSNK